MVSIPIRTYSSGEASRAVSFNLLHEKCKCRVKQKYVCPECDEAETVGRDQMVKGYEFSKGKYVSFTAEELATMAEESQKAIEIEEFVPLDTVDPVYFGSAYYLGPDAGGEKAYKLLGDALRSTGRVALAKWAARGKQHLVMIRPFNGTGMVMQQLRYAGEVKPALTIQDAEISDSELKLAVKLVNQNSSDEFHPEKYKDEVRARYLAAIKRKVDGGEVEDPESDAPRGEVLDLMAALTASLKEKK